MPIRNDQGDVVQPWYQRIWQSFWFTPRPSTGEGLAQVTAPALAVHTQPTFQSPIIGTIYSPQLTRVYSTAVADGVVWARITSGWVQTRYLSMLHQPYY